MNFKEYCELSEDSKLFDELDENILTALPKFIGGAATNLGSQAVKGVGNVAGGLAKTAYGGIQAGTGALQALGGGTKSGWENIKKGVSSASSGTGKALTGATQIIAAPVSAVLRGAQATSEPIFPKKFDKDRSKFQKTFGLNKWEQEKNPKQKRWSQLVKAYKSMDPKNQIERNKILKQLKELDPERYYQTKRMSKKDKEQEKIKRFLTGLEKSA